MDKYEVCSQSPVKQEAVDQVVPRMEVDTSSDIKSIDLISRD